MTSDFDVFLSYHSPDRATVEELGRRLEERGLKVWLDAWRLRPGMPWRRELEAQIESVGAAAVIVGASGTGPWQGEEIDALLQAFVGRGCPIIPVVLADAGKTLELPPFLKSRTWVDFRESDSNPLDRLIWGITGEEPARPTPSYPDDATRDLSESLEAAYRQKADLDASGEDTKEVVEEILALRRRLRQGAQLKAGDFLLDGRFQLLEEIGQGGFAQVWKAYDRDGRAQVAVKVLHGQHTGDASRRERFFRGARHMARLAHPNIVQVIEESCDDDEYPFFVMEYLGGGDFRKAVLADRFSLAERLQIVLEVGKALAFAHARGVIHRDIKPHNILLGVDGSPKLTDFDLVRAADTTGGTRTAMLGTFLYAAPEAMADARQAAEPADVYGLGMTAVFALHGADLPSDVLWELPQLVAGLEASEACRQALLRAVARKLDERWATVDAFCGALNKATVSPSETVAHDSRSPPLEDSPPDQETLHEKDGSVLVYVPGGEFPLGGEDELEHCVNLSPYWIGKHPVTNEQYAKFLKANPGQQKPRFWKDERFNGPRQPVVGVSWLEATAYCNWAGLELPTEARWEAAARGTDRRPYPWGSEPPAAEFADFAKSWQSDKPDPVGSHPAGAGPYGAEDQAGCVWEWCFDDFDASAYSAHDGKRNPVAEPEDEEALGSADRVVRGGSWAFPARSLHAAIRLRFRAGSRDQLLGFRVCRSAPEP